MQPYDDRTLRRLADSQDGLLTRGQCLGAGLTIGEYRHRTRPGGPWPVLLPTVVATFTGIPTVRQRRRAALLRYGPEAMLACGDALDLHGLRAAPTRAGVHVLLPATSGATGGGFVVAHRSTRAPTPVRVAGMPVAPLPRAVVDAARELRSDRAVRAVVADAVQQGRASVADLATELRCGESAGSRLARAALAEVADGVRSVAEGDFRALVASSELPAPLWNPTLITAAGDFLARPDGWWREASLVFEVDSRRWHLSPDDWERTQRRHAAMTACGLLVLHASPKEISARPGAVLRDLRKAYEHGLRMPPAAVRLRAVAPS